MKDKRKLIMVMGVQRSGTTALFNSLARDPRLTALDESVDNPVYYKYRLRPLAEIAPVLDAARGAVLLKPLSETFYRSLEELAAEYDEYDLRIVWIYRDPVNVLYSMHRQGWVSPLQIDQPMQLSQWVRRNRLALRFQQHDANQIAFIRYEDCYTDPLVFRQLAAWLRVEGHSLFREESAQGRLRLPRATQLKIDAAARATLSALDAARSFKARSLYRAKLSASNLLAKFQKKLTQAFERERPDATPDWDAAILSASPILPSKVEGLQFWLDPDKNKLGAELYESGPRRLQARGDLPWPFQIPCLNGKPALFFPQEMTLVRRQDTPGILSFGAEEAWSFFLEGRPFSIFVLFKPQVRTTAPNEQRRAVVLRLGPSRGRPAFILEWDRHLKASKAILLGPETADENILVTPSGAHAHQQWRMLFFRRNGTHQAHLSISINGFAASSMVAHTLSGDTLTRGPDCTLQLGGDAAQRDALFFGAIAELIVFDRALTTEEQGGITRYLKEKYSL